MIAALSEDYGLLFHTDENWFLQSSECDVCSDQFYLDETLSCDTFGCDVGNLESACKVSTQRNINADLKIVGNGTFILDYGGSIICDKPNCKVHLNIAKNQCQSDHIAWRDACFLNRGVLSKDNHYWKSKRANSWFNMRIDGDGGDCCGAACSSSAPLQGGGGGGHGGFGGGCCYSSKGGGAYFDNASSPWSYGGSGYMANLGLVRSGTCESVARSRARSSAARRRMSTLAPRATRGAAS